MSHFLSTILSFQLTSSSFQHANSCSPSALFQEVELSSTGREAGSRQKSVGLVLSGPQVWTLLLFLNSFFLICHQYFLVAFFFFLEIQYSKYKILIPYVLGETNKRPKTVSHHHISLLLFIVKFLRISLLMEASPPFPIFFSF